MAAAATFSVSHENGQYLIRLGDPKNLYIYISGFEEILEKKLK